MPTNYETLGIDRLSVRERLELIEQIWDNLPEPVAECEVPDWHLAEITKRRAEAAENPGQGRPWRKAIDSLGKTR